MARFPWMRLLVPLVNRLSVMVIWASEAKMLLFKLPWNVAP